MIAAYIFAALGVCSLAYYALGLAAARSFAAQDDAPPAPQLPPLSILKPLKGCDPQMYESLRSHCLQEYPLFEIIFGVNNTADPAIAYIEGLMREFPGVPMQLVVSAAASGANRKVSNLVQMLERAQFEHVLINDGDIRVPDDYLRQVMTAFHSAGDTPVGMVTCLYRGVAGKTVWSRLEAMGINTDFMSGVLTARFLEGGVRFALGSTMATTKTAIAAIGGLQTLADYLADDYELGKRVAAAGYRVIIPRTVVETFLPDYSFRGFVDHQLRWGRTVRSSRPGGYFGMAATFGMLWALLAVIASGGVGWSWFLLAAVLTGKTLLTFAVGKRIIGNGAALSHLWLLPLRELVTPLVWLVSLFGSRIVWRGDVFTLRDGKLLPR